MTHKDEAMMDRFRGPGHCEYCNRWTDRLEPHHIFRRRPRIDLPEFLIALCGAFVADCHGRADRYEIPRQRLVEIAANREGMLPEAILTRWYELARAPKGSEIPQKDNAMTEAEIERLAISRGGKVIRMQPTITPGPSFYVRDDMTEKEFMSAVIKLAESKGWKVYHTHDSRRSQTGYPDLTMVRCNDVAGGRVIFAELKTETGKTTKAQDDWLRALEAAGQEVHLWRPSCWDGIVRLLS